MNWTTLPINGELSNLTSTATYANTITSNWFWPLMLVAAFMISYIVMSRYTTVRALLASSYMTFVLSILLFYAGLLTEAVFYGFFAMVVLMIIASFFFE